MTETEWKESFKAQCGQIVEQQEKLIAHINRLDELKASGSDPEELAEFIILELAKVEKSIEALK